MFLFRAAFALASFGTLVRANSHLNEVDPLSKVDAEAAVLRMKNTMTFTEGFVDATYKQNLAAGIASSKTFATTCKDVKDDGCREGVEEKPNSVCCASGRKECKYDAQGKEIQCDAFCADANNSVNAFCTVAGQKKFKRLVVCGTGKGSCNTCKAGNVTIANMKEKSDCERQGCCNFGNGCTLINNANDCKASCYVNGVKRHSFPQEQCKDSCVFGMPQPQYTTNVTCLQNAYHEWETRVWRVPTYTAAVYTEVVAGDEATCGRGDTCNRCENCGFGSGCPGEKSGCDGPGSTHGSCSDVTKTSKDMCLATHENHSRTWTPARWVTITGATTESACTGSDRDRRLSGVVQVANTGPAVWQRQNSWNKGETMVDKRFQPVISGDKFVECSTGPYHSEPSHIMPAECVLQDVFMKDAGDAKAVDAAILGNKALYSKFMARILGSPLVTNAVGVVVKSAFTLDAKACFTIVSAPENHGKVNFNGSDKTFAVILNPQNFADADTLAISGGTAMVLGGVNAGTIKSTTTKSLEVYGVKNSGNLDVKNSRGIVVADVQNNGGTITVDNIGVTLINVKSTGKVVATGPKGKYNAYNIVNSGSINIAEGLIDLHFSDNTGGTVTIGDKVTGKISYEGGKGTITAPSGVTVTEVKAIGPPAKKVTGNLKIAVPAAKAASFKTDPKVKVALQDAIAGSIVGVDRYMVRILGVTEATGGRRLSDDDRRLSTTSITVKYEITLPKDNSVTVAAAQAAVTGASAKTTLATLVNKELKAQGVVAEISVEETTAAESSGPTSTTAAQTTQQQTSVEQTTSSVASSHMFNAVAAVTMMAVQLWA